MEQFTSEQGCFTHPFALPLLMLCFVTFLACVAMDDVVPGGLIMHNIQKYNFWFGRPFQLGPMSSFAEETTTVKAGVLLFEIRVFCALHFVWT